MKKRTLFGFVLLALLIGLMAREIIRLRGEVLWHNSQIIEMDRRLHLVEVKLWPEAP